jgi:hypothetical protein
VDAAHHVALAGCQGRDKSDLNSQHLQRLHRLAPSHGPSSILYAAPADEPSQRTIMDATTQRSSRLRIVRDVVVFQIKCAFEALLDLTLIPVSLVAAGFDLVLGNWRRPRLFHAVLRFGERCERRIDLWGVGKNSEVADAEVDAVMRSIETLMRSPSTGPQKVRELRRWAATKLAPGGAEAPPPAKRGSDGAD